MANINNSHSSPENKVNPDFLNIDSVDNVKLEKTLDTYVDKGEIEVGLNRVENSKEKKPVSSIKYSSPEVESSNNQNLNVEEVIAAEKKIENIENQDEANSLIGNSFISIDSQQASEADKLVKTVEVLQGFQEKS